MERGKPRQVVRSAETGRFVKKSDAKKHPETTVVETVKKQRDGK